MPISVFDLFSIGIGPSSSHTVGPMKAANRFVNHLCQENQIKQVKRLTTELFGSLAFTGKGHDTDKAILSGLEGKMPGTVDPATIKPRAIEITEKRKIRIAGTHEIAFDYPTDMIYNYKDLLPYHTNGMRFSAYDDNNHLINSEIYYSIGGGFIINEKQSLHPKPVNNATLPYPFATAKSLLELCDKNNLTISHIMFTIP